MKKVVEKELYDDIQFWGIGDVTHTPVLAEIPLDEKEGWFIGQKVKVTIESMSEEMKK